jgi:hypothetical protein
MKTCWLATQSDIVKAVLLGGALLLVTPSLSFAQTKMDQIFNDEAIQRYLAEADPAVGYITRLKMMRSHLTASVLNLNAGRREDAHAHVAHPMEEIWDGLEKALKPEDAAILKQSLIAAQTAVDSHDDAKSITHIDLTTSVLMRLEQAAIKDLKNPGMLTDVVAVLLRTAVVEYHEAFDGKTIKNLVEYHDGAMFVREAQATLETISPALEAKDPEAFAQTKATLEKLYAAWPLPGVPEKVASVTKLQTLVTLTEIKLSALR